MADTQPAEQQTVAQPMQPEVPSMESNLEKARRVDTRTTIVLNAVQAYDELEQFGTEAIKYTRGALEGQDYYQFKFRGSICIVTPEFKKAFDEGSLLGLTAVPTVFEQMRPDPNNAGKQMAVVSQGWSLSFTDLEKRKKAMVAQGKAKSLEIEGKKGSLEMMIEEKKLDKQLEYIAAKDLTELISKEEMDQLMKSAGATA